MGKTDRANSKIAVFIENRQRHIRRSIFRNAEDVDPGTITCLLRLDGVYTKDFEPTSPIARSWPSGLKERQLALLVRALAFAFPVKSAYESPYDNGPPSP